jgi:pimeloyl-ACP methyl ester carboxylesterase
LRGRKGERRIYWVGTSMGGLLGMLLAAMPQSPIARLVVNDVGPLIPRESLQRIGAYLGKNPTFKTFEELDAYIRQISAPFGPLTDAQWHHLHQFQRRQGRADCEVQGGALVDLARIEFSHSKR